MEGKTTKRSGLFFQDDVVRYTRSNYSPPSAGGAMRRKYASIAAAFAVFSLILAVVAIIQGNMPGAVGASACFGAWSTGAGCILLGTARTDGGEGSHD